MRLSARGLGAIFGRLLIGTAEVIPASELVGTTGCGDAFIGAVLQGEELFLLLQQSPFEAPFFVRFCLRNRNITLLPKRIYTIAITGYITIRNRNFVKQVPKRLSRVRLLYYRSD